MNRPTIRSRSQSGASFARSRLVSQADRVIDEMPCPQQPRDEETHSETKQNDGQSNYFGPGLLSAMSLVLDNTGSVARDHMANERTFLAWVRTALVFVTLTVGFIQFYRMELKSTVAFVDGVRYDLPRDNASLVIEKIGRPIGILSSSMGLLAILFGTSRYFLVQQLLTKSHYPATRITVAVLMLLTLALLVLLLVLDVKVTVN